MLSSCNPTGSAVRTPPAIVQGRPRLDGLNDQVNEQNIYNGITCGIEIGAEAVNRVKKRLHLFCERVVLLEGITNGLLIVGVKGQRARCQVAGMQAEATGRPYKIYMPSVELCLVLKTRGQCC